MIASDLDITLWGPPASGKTTYLSVLNIAVAKASPTWTLTGADEGSTAALIKRTAMLVRDGRFPEATALGIENYRYVMSGVLDDGVRSVPAKFGLSIVDASGELYYQRRGFPGEAALVRRLAASNGVIFFFDPTIEAARQVAYENFHATAARLEKEAGVSSGERLPHHVAVCIAKYDEPAVFSFALENDYLVTDANDYHGIPRVTEERARDFFDALYRKFNQGAGALLSHTIERYFYRDRIRYFAISPVGFRLDSSGRFDPDDYYNIVPSQIYQAQLARGDILPVNILEPLLWLSAPDIYAAAIGRRSRSFQRWAPRREPSGNARRAASAAAGVTRSIRPAHVIFVAEATGARGDSARLERIEQLIAVAHDANRDLRVSLISYGSHSVSARFRESPATVIAWDTTPAVVIGLLSNLRQGYPAGREDILAAQIECALAEVARRLSREDPAALVTAGFRPAFPMRMTGESRTLPCPKRNDWTGSMAELQGREVTFGAIHDHPYEYDYLGRPVDAVNDIWAELGANANATVSEIIDVYRFAAALGLVSADHNEQYPPQWHHDRWWSSEESLTTPAWPGDKPDEPGDKPPDPGQREDTERQHGTQYHSIEMRYGDDDL